MSNIDPYSVSDGRSEVLVRRCHPPIGLILTPDGNKIAVALDADLVSIGRRVPAGGHGE